MGKDTGIQWTDSTWPIVNGCVRVSEGCRHCYAERLIATRLSKTPKYEGLATMTDNGPRWNGQTRLWEPHLEWPLRWTKPRKIFVADMGDLFYEGVSTADIDRVFAITFTTACVQKLAFWAAKEADRITGDCESAVMRGSPQINICGVRRADTRALVMLALVMARDATYVGAYPSGDGEKRRKRVNVRSVLSRSGSVYGGRANE